MLATLRRLAPYVARYRSRYVLGLVALLLRGTLAAVIPYLIGRAIDQLAADQYDEAFDTTVLLVLVAGTKGVFQYAMRWILITLSRDVEFDLRNDLTRHLLTLDRHFYERYKTGDLMSRATNDLAQVRSLLGPGLMYSAEIAVILVTVVSFMAWVDLVMTAAILAPLLPVSLVVAHFGGKTHAQFQRVQQRFSDISAHVQEHIASLRMLRAYGQQLAEVDRFNRANAEYFESSLGLVRIWRRFYPLLDLLVGLSGITALVCGGWRVVEGAMTVGTLTTFLYLLTMLAWPMVGMGVVVNITQRGLASLGRLNELLTFRPRVCDAKRLQSRGARIWAPVDWAGASVRYPTATRRALREVTLHLPEGETLAVIGPVGCGKSTLANLLPRLFDPTSGRVLARGLDIRAVQLATLRRCVGCVPQETILFSRSIADNIRLGRPGASDADVHLAARTAMLDTENDSFPDGLDTLVGERGITLSGGQKQRVALARALLVNPEILVLDDATSSVDAETERGLVRNLREATLKRTLLIVTHRVSLAMLADRIAVMYAGEVAAVGTHSELLARDGTYARMFERQRLEEELAGP